MIDIEELLPRWRAYSTGLVESGAVQAMEERGQAAGAERNRPSHLAEWMQAFVAQQIFPVCLDWLRQEGVSSVVPAAYAVDAEDFFQSVQSCFFLSEDLLCAISTAPRARRGRLGALLANFWNRLPVLALALRFHKTGNANRESCNPSLAAASDQSPDFIAGCVRNLLRHNSDVVLVLCLAHPFVHGSASESATRKAATAADEPSAIFEAIALVAQALRREPSDPQELQDMARELVQRFQDEGYEWEVVEEGAPYQEAMREHFDTFGHIAQDQPVKTIKAALLRNGVAKNKGVIRRIRHSHGDR